MMNQLRRRSVTHMARGRRYIRARRIPTTKNAVPFFLWPVSFSLSAISWVPILSEAVAEIEENVPSLFSFLFCLSVLFCWSAVPRAKPIAGPRTRPMTPNPLLQTNHYDISPSKSNKS